MFDFFKKKKPETKEQIPIPRPRPKPTPDRPRITWQEICKELSDTGPNVVLPHSDRELGKEILTQKGLFYDEDQVKRFPMTYEEESAQAISNAIDSIIEKRQQPALEIGKSLTTLETKYNELKSRIEKLEQREETHGTTKKKAGQPESAKKGKKNS